MPGKLYSLKLFTGDYDDLTSGVSEEKTHAVKIEISDVTMVTAECFQKTFYSTWNGEIGDFTYGNPFWVNYHVRVFEAGDTEATLTISDWITQGRTDPSEVVDQRVAYNFVEIQPYLE